MNIQVLGQTELKLSRFDLAELNVNLKNEVTHYSAIAMFITSLAKCTISTTVKDCIEINTAVFNSKDDSLITSSD